MLYTKHQVDQIFSYLRAASPTNRLTQAQVNAADKIIATCGLDLFAASIGFELNLTSPVSGQFDISPNGFNIIKRYEGLKLKAYRDTGGVWTIGYGTIKYANGTSVKQGDTCTEEQALSFMMHDCKWVDACLDKYVKIKVNQNQFDALASFVYNIGESQFRTSTLLKKLNEGKFQEAADNFPRWIYDNGKKIQGLVNRRNEERALFLS